MDVLAWALAPITGLPAWMIMSPAELVATVTGLISVWYTAKRNIWTWPTGLVMVALYIAIFYNAKLYTDALLQVIYVVAQIYGWYMWVYGGANRTELQFAPIGRGHQE